MGHEIRVQGCARITLRIEDTNVLALPVDPDDSPPPIADTGHASAPATCLDAAPLVLRRGHGL
jgi:hypothetical protein